jgi:RNA polymerase sigma-70 factor, ECF subfamily
MTGNTPVGMLLTKGLVVERGEPSSYGDAKELTLAISRGDEAGFNVFYNEYSLRVYKLLLVVTRGNEEICGELHQRVMIKAARKIKVLETHGKIWAWLATVARNEWKDHCRARAREAQRFGREIVDSASERAEEADVTRLQRCEFLQEALSELSVAERELVESFYVDEISQAELGRKSGRTAKAIECAIARVRARLKRIMEGKR